MAPLLGLGLGLSRAGRWWITVVMSGHLRLWSRSSHTHAGQKPTHNGLCKHSHLEAVKGAQLWRKVGEGVLGEHQPLQR